MEHMQLKPMTRKELLEGLPARVVSAIETIRTAKNPGVIEETYSFAWRYLETSDLKEGPKSRGYVAIDGAVIEGYSRLYSSPQRPN